jgi:lipid II:glycine glycyltransferase (peptidoglycan interpeptide bridge formation enzyme)
MTFGGTTSYHHGASTHKYAKIPSSYLLQWTAIHDALLRGDDIYNFWGIAPRKILENGDEVIIDKKHPFAGVTTFKTGFGGKPLPLTHCADIPSHPATGLREHLNTSANGNGASDAILAACHARPSQPMRK